MYRTPQSNLSTECVRFSSQPVEIYVNFIRVPPAIFKRPPPTAYKISQFTANSVLSQSVRSWGVWISLVAQKTMCRICIQYIQLCAVTMHKLHKFQNKVAIMPANIPPGILELVVRLSGRGLSQRAISRNKRVSQGGISKVLRRVRETGRAIQRPHGHRLRMTTPREDRALVRTMNRNRFLSSSRIRVELTSELGVVFLPTRQRCLVAAGYRSRRSAFTTVMVVPEFVGVLIRDWWTLASKKWIEMSASPSWYGVFSMHQANRGW